MRFLLHQVRYGYSFSLSARCFSSSPLFTSPHHFVSPRLNVRVPLTQPNLLPLPLTFSAFFSLPLFPSPPVCLSALFSAPLFTFSLLSTFLCRGPFVENVVIQFIPRSSAFFYPFPSPSFYFSPLFFPSSSLSPSFRLLCFVSFVRYLPMFFYEILRVLKIDKVIFFLNSEPFSYSIFSKVRGKIYF